MEQDKYISLTIAAVDRRGRPIEIPFDQGTYTQMQQATLKRYAGTDAKHEGAQEVATLEAKKGKEPRAFRDLQVQLLMRTEGDTNDALAKSLLLRAYPEEAKEVYRQESNPVGLPAELLVEKLQRMWTVNNKNLFTGTGNKVKSVAATRTAKRSRIDSDSNMRVMMTMLFPQVAPAPCTQGGTRYGRVTVAGMECLENDPRAQDARSAEVQRQGVCKFCWEGPSDGGLRGA
ncbi:hypothetical protein JKP88DRAFT_242354 [Tribonema minus]|uniref:Uncharacterized protein n=1 Tax=Tribonema minus TaxID=303371 RepID=A0A836C9R6_9STRA|nr:hypothetical protein JKP88DRAFT_242354 [Tribonema minus]